MSEYQELLQRIRNEYALEVSSARRGIDAYSINSKVVELIKMVYGLQNMEEYIVMVSFIPSALNSLVMEENDTLTDIYYCEMHKFPITRVTPQLSIADTGNAVKRVLERGKSKIIAFPYLIGYWNKMRKIAHLVHDSKIYAGYPEIFLVRKDLYKELDLRNAEYTKNYNECMESAWSRSFLDAIDFACFETRVSIYATENIQVDI